MFDIRDHGIAQQKGGLDKFPISGTPTSVLLTKALSYSSYQLDVSKYLSQYPTVAYTSVVSNTSSPKVEKNFYNSSDVYLGNKLLATLSTNVSSVTLLQDGYHALEQGTSGKRYVIKNDIVLKQYTLNYQQYLLYSDGTYIISYDYSNLYVYKNGVLVKTKSGFPGTNYVSLKFAKDAVILVTNLSTSNIAYIVLLKDIPDIQVTDSSVNTVTALFLATSKIMGGNF